MMELTSTEVFMVGADKIEDLIQESFGQEYSFVAALECGNEVTKRFWNMDGSDYDEEDIQAFLDEGHPYPSPDDLMDYLIHEELIPPGTYIVDCSW